MKLRKRHLEIGLLIIIVFTILAFQSPIPQNIKKNYPPSLETKYWFELENDLVFSEEFHLPGYSQAEYGKLEYPSIVIDSQKKCLSCL